MHSNTHARSNDVIACNCELQLFALLDMLVQWESVLVAWIWFPSLLLPMHGFVHECDTYMSMSWIRELLYAVYTQLYAHLRSNLASYFGAGRLVGAFVCLYFWRTFGVFLTYLENLLHRLVFCIFICLKRIFFRNPRICFRQICIVFAKFVFFRRICIFDLEAFVFFRISKDDATDF